jgi:hypothetical protein
VSERHCHTCNRTVRDDIVMGAYWSETPACARVGCDARFNIIKGREAWAAARAAASDFCGPSRGVCAVCGEEIGAYESRQFGKAGAVHVWKRDDAAGSCLTPENKHLYPFYYTDG